MVTSIYSTNVLVANLSHYNMATVALEPILVTSSCTFWHVWAIYSWCVKSNFLFIFVWTAKKWYFEHQPYSRPVTIEQLYLLSHYIAWLHDLYHLNCDTIWKLVNKAHCTIYKSASFLVREKLLTTIGFALINISTKWTNL